MMAATSIGTDLEKEKQVKIIPAYLTRSPVVQSRPKTGGPAQGVGGGLHPVVDPDLDEVGVGDVSDHVIPVVSVVPRPVDGSHLGANACMKIWVKILV